jgi:hypothetical protein
MTASKTVDPFELHPEIEPQEKNLGDVTLTLMQIREIILNKMIEVRTEPTPHWGFDKHYVTAVLTGLIFELEEKCQNN